MKNIDPTTADFADLITRGCIYVDKTEYVWKLVNGFRYNFVCRPRRFGKSLLLSTVKAFFMGRKELFKELAIGQKAYDWKEYPVIHLDFGKVKTRTFDTMECCLNNVLDDNAIRYHITLPPGEPQERFHILIRELSQRGKIVLLIDEYDHPILDHIRESDLHEIIEYYRDFYRLIKAESEVIHFVLVAGVSNVALTSFYSSFNNPKDLSRMPEYATLFGYTQEELEQYFSEHIATAATTWGKTEEFIKEKIRFWYDGYHFCKNGPNVYNPVSIGNFFTGNYEFENFWIRTGTPYHLRIAMKEKNYDIERVLAGMFGAEIFDPIDPEMNLPITRLLFQSGYLTIKNAETDPESLTTSYQLCYPNREVEMSFHVLKLILCAGFDDETVGVICRTLLMSLQNCDMNALKDTLMTFYSKITYGPIKDVNREAYFHAATSALFIILNDYTFMEYQTNNGSIDIVVKTRSYTYLFEIKVNKKAKNAIAQIKRKEYFQPFLLEPRDIVLIGINFNTDLRQIDDWKAERMSVPAK